MKRKILIATAGIVISSAMLLAQYTGGSGGGYIVGTSASGWASETTSLITASPETVYLSGGADSSTITVQLKDAGSSNLAVGGDVVLLSTTFGSLGSVTDNGDGTYAAVLTVSATGTATITGTVNGISIVDTAAVIVNEVLRLTVKAFLQGPYNTGTGAMNISLKSAGLLASHFGGTPIPGSAVDSINIELRDSASASQATIRVYAAAWLMSDGTVKSFSDTTKEYAELDAPLGSYYIVVRHRSHISIMSSAKAVFATDSTGYDFTTAQDKAYGTYPMAALSGGVFALPAADVNGNGGVGADDITAVYLSVGLSEYTVFDVNMNSGVGADDITATYFNVGFGSQVPN